LPVGLVVDGAHVHDAVLAKDAFVGVVVRDLSVKDLMFGIFRLIKATAS